MARLYGLFANLAGRTVLVVGGGQVALRKVRALLAAGAQVVVNAPVLTAELRQLAREKRVIWREEAFAARLLDDAWLVVVATSDRQLNEQVALLCRQQKKLVNVVDNVALSSFHVPAVIDRGALQVAVSTAGAAPVLAQAIRSDIEKRLDASLGGLVALLAGARQRIKRHFPAIRQRRAFYAELLDSGITELLRQGEKQDAEQLLEQKLQAQAQSTQGRVVLVGAGPGDPGLLTLRGLKMLEQADVILHDRLVSAEVLALARRDATFIEVGKEAGHHHVTQDGIHALMVKHARTGALVVRLKGGDPFVFGRGGEELEHLAAQGIPFEVVPGITAALACGAYAGIPLTHRDYAQSVRLVTAHGSDSLDRLDWEGLARDRQTLVFYMGVGRLAVLQENLMGWGRAGATPVALVEQGSRAEQRVVRGRLDELQQVAEREAIRSPAVLIVGEVTALAESLHWFGQLIPEQSARQELARAV